MATRTTTGYVLPGLGSDPATTTVQIPAGARLLCIAVDDQRRVGLWFEHMDDVKTEGRRLQVLRTGQAIAASARHVGSAYSWDNDEVLHVYELQDDPKHKTEVRPFGGGQAWAQCTCSWRSSLQHTEAAAEAAAEEHRDHPVG